jgi:hypothetical protein
MGVAWRGSALKNISLDGASMSVTVLPLMDGSFAYSARSCRLAFSWVAWQPALEPSESLMTQNFEPFLAICQGVDCLLRVLDLSLERRGKVGLLRMEECLGREDLERLR